MPKMYTFFSSKLIICELAGEAHALLCIVNQAKKVEFKNSEDNGAGASLKDPFGKKHLQHSKSLRQHQL